MKPSSPVSPTLRRSPPSSSIHKQRPCSVINKKAAAEQKDPPNTASRCTGKKEKSFNGAFLLLLLLCRPPLFASLVGIRG